MFNDNLNTHIVYKLLRTRASGNTLMPFLQEPTSKRTKKNTISDDHGDIFVTSHYLYDATN